jgi:LysR family transcriptional regulator for metE and metH
VADAERDLARLREGRAGPLRVAVECHTCFDWLMPAMDAFRPRWPEVELDLVSGFQMDPVPMLLKNAADFAVIHDRPEPRRGIVFQPLFEYETVALLARGHRLAGRARLEARDFAQETLIAYPVDDDKLDVMRHLLLPAGLKPRARRHAELTVAIVQLVASGRGIAALPAWSVAPYLARGYVVAKPIGRKGLRCELYGATTAHLAETAYIREFVELIRQAGAEFGAQ